MMSREQVVANGLIVLPDQGIIKADIVIRDGRIVGITESGVRHSPEAHFIDASGRHVFPGIIDAHVHFGYAEPPNEYATETRHAAKGGVSTILSYVLRNETYRGVFEQVKEECEARAYVDFGLHFCASSDLHIEELAGYAREFGVTSLKYFMQYKGEEGRYVGLDGTDDGFMYDLFAAAAEIPDLVLVVHPENIEVVNRLRRRAQLEGRDGLREFCLWKPAFTEAENMLRAMYFAEHAGCTIYFPHVSCAMGIEEVRRYRRRYGRVLVETCPHYLTHTLDADVGSIGKSNPPFRTQQDVDALWQALEDGTIDVVGSDHVPRKRATKEKGIWQASQGFPGIALILPLLLSEGFHKGRLGLQQIARLLSQNPARIFGIGARKGNIAIGHDADLTIVDLEAVREVRAAELGSYSDYSLYEGWKLRGWPVGTMVRGETVMKDGEIVGRPGYGRYLRRPA